MDAFAELGLERRLGVSEEEIRAAFREAGKVRHPDAGGDAADFAKLQEALAVVSNPSARLKHWLELEGIEGGMRGAVRGELMELFSRIGPVLQEADAVIREKEVARSVLAKALLEGKVQACRERLEECQEWVETNASGLCGDFAQVEQGLTDGWELARELAFLGKWAAELRARYAALW